MRKDRKDAAKNSSMRKTLTSVCFIILLAATSYAAPAQGGRAQELYGRGKELSDQRRYDEAIAALDEAIALEPNRADLHFQLGRAYAGKLFTTGDDGLEAKADASLRRATELNSSLPDPHLLLARIARRKNRIEAAISSLERAIAIYERQGERDGEVVNAYAEKWQAMLKRSDFEKEVPRIRSEVEGLLARTTNREINLRAAAAGYGLLADDDALEKCEQAYLSEFADTRFAGQILSRRIQGEKDPARRVGLIEDYFKRFPDRQVPHYFLTAFRHYAGRADYPAERLVKLGELCIKTHTQTAYERVEVPITVATVLAERRVELDKAQAIIDEAVRFAEGLSVGAEALSDVKPAEQGRLIALLKDRASTARGFVLLRRGDAGRAAIDLTRGLRRVIEEVERRGILPWRDADLREIGVRPRVLWLAELYEAQKDYKRAARYFLAGYTDDERINGYIRERLTEVYRELNVDRQAALDNIKMAEKAYLEAVTPTDKSRGDDRARLLASRINSPAPDLKAVRLDKSTVGLQELRGKVVVLNFWATWCGPCVAEMPHFQKAADKYAANGEVVFLAISVDDNRQAARSFIEKHGYRFGVAYDEGAARGYKVDGIPATFIIDRRGVIQFRENGFGGSGEAYVERLSWRIDELLKEAKEAAAPAYKQ
jgi:peroxiredoxin